MVIVRATEFGERLKSLFSEAGGSNFYEHAPLSFEAKGQKGVQEPSELREQYIELFQDIASSILGKPYNHSIVSVPGITEFGNPVNGGKLVIHPTGVRLIKAEHDYYSNQWAYLCKGRTALPLIHLETFDFRKPKHPKEESSVLLKFIYGTVENKRKLFDAFENTIRSSEMPYKRRHSEMSLDYSLGSDLEFEEASPSRPQKF